MTTFETHIIGKCGDRNLVLKQWKSGYSVRCHKRKKKSLVSYPDDEFMRKYDLATFCEGCEEGEGGVNESESN